MIKFRCTCGEVVGTTDGDAGKWAYCPACRALLRVPDHTDLSMPVERPREAAPKRLRLAKLGADGGVAVFPIGFSEESEYRGFKEIANTSHKARQAGIPLLADTHFGREITDKNRLEAADLAAMMSTEAGADGVFVPCEEGKEKELWEKLQYAQIPVFLKISWRPDKDTPFPTMLENISRNSDS